MRGELYAIFDGYRKWTPSGVESKERKNWLGYLDIFGSWLGTRTSMLEVLTKPVPVKARGLPFGSSKPSAGYLSCMVCELLHRSEGFTLCTPKW